MSTDKFPDDYILQRLKATIAENEAKTTLDHFEYPLYLKNHVISLQNEYNLYDILILTKAYEPQYIQVTFIANQGVRIANVRWETPEEQNADEQDWKQKNFDSNLSVIDSLRWAYNDRIKDLESREK